jgi:hypothetical protein
MEISTSLYGVLHVLEVGLRNRIHTKMTEVFGKEEWWDAVPLYESELKDVSDAKKSLSENGILITPESVVSELNFGFWVKLFSGNYEKKLWVRVLRHRFQANLTRHILHARFKEVKELRNCIAHHKTLIKRDPRKDYAMLLETIKWISPTVQRWIEHHSDFPQVIDRVLPSKPSHPTHE